MPHGVLSPSDIEYIETYHAYARREIDIGSATVGNLSDTVDIFVSALE